MGRVAVLWSCDRWIHPEERLLSVLLLHNIPYVAHTSDITYSYTRVMIRMTQPPPALPMIMHIRPTLELLLLLKHYHYIPIFILWPSYDPSSCSSSTERPPHETALTSIANWQIFQGNLQSGLVFLMDTMLFEMLTVFCSAGGAAKYPCHLVIIMGKGKIVKCSYRKSYAKLWMTQTTASMPLNLFLLRGVCRISWESHDDVSEFRVHSELISTNVF